MSRFSAPSLRTTSRESRGGKCHPFSMRERLSGSTNWDVSASAASSPNRPDPPPRSPARAAAAALEWVM